MANLNDIHIGIRIDCSPQQQEEIRAVEAELKTMCPRQSPLDVLNRRDNLNSNTYAYLKFRYDTQMACIAYSDDDALLGLTKRCLLNYIEYLMSHIRGLGGEWDPEIHHGYHDCEEGGCDTDRQST